MRSLLPSWLILILQNMFRAIIYGSTQLANMFDISLSSVCISRISVQVLLDYA